MIKSIFIIMICFNTAILSTIMGQSDKCYKELLLSNKNDLFPKQIIYDGPKLLINYKDYYRLGFDYICAYSLENPKNVPNRFKYILWTGVASNDAKAKWSTEKSPFVDDIDQYEERWADRHNFYKNKYYNPNDNDNFGIIVLDIEAKINNNQLEKNPPFRSEGTKNKERAISEYKTEMEKLYRYPLEFSKSNHNNYIIWSSYGDVPVERNWWDIPKRTWIEWISDPSHLNYITNSTKNGLTTETEFAEKLDIFTVSSYFFYNPEYYSPNIANQYLAYLLFQLEANQAWTEKPIYLYLTFKFQADKGRGTLISNEMVKNSLIFAFMSGADGIVLFEASRSPTNNTKYHKLLKTFIETISVLDDYREYFEDKNVIFYKPDNARDLFAHRETIIRGIEKNGKLLIAATNPFAKVNEITKIPIYYKGKSIIIQLVGKETYLKEFIL